MRTLSEMTRSVAVMDAAGAGTSDDQGTAVIDMSGWEGVMFLFHMATIAATAVTTGVIQGSDTNVAADFADLVGAEVSIPADGSDLVHVLDLYRPQKRYLRAGLDRGTANATLLGVTAIRYNTRYTGAETPADGASARVSYAA